MKLSYIIIDGTEYLLNSIIFKLNKLKEEANQDIFEVCYEKIGYGNILDIKAEKFESEISSKFPESFSIVKNILWGYVVYFCSSENWNEEGTIKINFYINHYFYNLIEDELTNRYDGALNNYSVSSDDSIGEDYSVIINASDTERIEYAKRFLQELPEIIKTSEKYKQFLSILEWKVSGN